MVANIAKYSDAELKYDQSRLSSDKEYGRLLIKKMVDVLKGGSEKHPIFTQDNIGIFNLFNALGEVLDVKRLRSDDEYAGDIRRQLKAMFSDSDVLQRVYRGEELKDEDFRNPGLFYIKSYVFSNRNLEKCSNIKPKYDPKKFESDKAYARKIIEKFVDMLKAQP